MPPSKQYVNASRLLAGQRYEDARNLLSHASCHGLDGLLLNAIEQDLAGSNLEAINNYRQAIENGGGTIGAAQALCRLLHKEYRNREMLPVYRDVIYPLLRLPPVKQPVADFRQVSIERVLALYFFGRSGTAFFASLLDGHPEVIGPALGLEALPFCWYKVGCSSLRALLAMIAVPFSPVYNFEPLFSAYGIDRYEFLSMVSHILEVPREKDDAVDGKRLLTALALGHRVLTGAPFANGPCVLFFHGHQFKPEKSLFLQECFGESVSIMFMVREPFQTVASHYVQAARNPIHSCHNIASGPSFGINLMKVYLEKNDHEKAFAIRLEDLKRDPQTVLKRFCRHVNIGWHGCLLESTLNGKEFVFRSGKENIKGFDTRPLQRRHREFFSTFDEWRLRILLAENSMAWGYPVPTWIGNKMVRSFCSLALLLPFGFEFRQARENRKSGRSIVGVMVDWLLEYGRIRILFFRKIKEDTVGEKRIVSLLEPHI